MRSRCLSCLYALIFIASLLQIPLSHFFQNMLKLLRHRVGWSLLLGLIAPVSIPQLSQSSQAADIPPFSAPAPLLSPASEPAFSSPLTPHSQPELAPVSPTVE